MSTSKWLAFALALFSIGASAQVNQTRTGILHSVFEGALGDRWEPYISVTGLTALKTFGTVNATTEDGVLLSSEMAAPASLHTQIGAYVVSDKTSMRLRLSLAHTYIHVTSDIGNAQLHGGSIELMPFYQWSRHRLGLGIQQFVIAKLNTADMGGDNFNIGAPTGFAFEYGYFFRDLRSWINLRAQMTTFNVAEGDRVGLNSSLSDQSLGLGISFQFM